MTAALQAALLFGENAWHASGVASTGPRAAGPTAQACVRL